MSATTNSAENQTTPIKERLETATGVTKTPESLATNEGYILENAAGPGAAVKPGNAGPRL